MADDSQQQAQQDGSTAAAASVAATQSMFGSGTFTMPDDLKKQFPDLTDLISRSESMNDEERQYWVNLLPIMTPEQIQNLKDILVNERQQLDAIDAKYQKEIDQVGQEEFLKRVEEERKQRAEQRSTAEQQAKASEGTSADDLLKQIENT
jgi:hypothetical protein